jgi:adenylosuccinate lyase
MELNTLTAISPIDGRYRQQVQHLGDYFSEYALIKYRVLVVVEYFLFLSAKKLFPLPTAMRKQLQSVMENFGQADAQWIKNKEKDTNHDVKAVEYFLKAKLEEGPASKAAEDKASGKTKAGVPRSATAKATASGSNGAGDVREWIHFGLTSQDINNTAIPLAWKHALEFEYLPDLLNLNKQLKILAQEWSEVPMLARTHGQPASPTLLGKEIMVFVERIEDQVEQLIQVPFSAKFGGATGNFNAHYVAFPKKDWVKLANEFVEGTLGLQRQQYTTQIEHYDHLSAHFDAIKRINTILIDFCRDVWTYVSMDYFKQKIRKGEIGSSAMPHKVNPIDFENAEGNLGVANALFEHFSSKLPISRLQRDLTDSTVLRNIGVPLAHTVLALRSIEKGLEKLVLNREKLHQDLENNWAVVAEAIQTVLRREKYPAPYEALKELTRGNAGITKQTLHVFIDGLKVSAAVKKELKKITPHNYTGVRLTASREK